MIGPFFVQGHVAHFINHQQCDLTQPFQSRGQRLISQCRVQIREELVQRGEQHFVARLTRFERQRDRGVCFNASI
jgi:hypothetical protein